MRPHGVEFFPFALETGIGKRLKKTQTDQLSKRLWQKDPTLWITDRKLAATTPELVNRLGWLDLPKQMASPAKEYVAFSKELLREKFSTIVLLGMGGSSMAPEVLMRIFGTARGYPLLKVLDSTHPEAILRLQKSIDLQKSLFVVASKSGGTVETLTLMRYFHDQIGIDSDSPGGNFIAITDPGSKLEAMSRDLGMRRVFASPPEVGGRFSALSVFGMLPAALIGVDPAPLLTSGGAMASACGASVEGATNPGVALGVFLGECLAAGRDKLLLSSTPQLAPFEVWLEQLIAESTGKNGTGLVPVSGLHNETIDVADDVWHALFCLEGEHNEAQEARATLLAKKKIPHVRVVLANREALGGEFFRWEFATAVAGALMQVNPFDQPNVELAKVKARALAQGESDKSVVPKPQIQSAWCELYAPATKSKARSPGKIDNDKMITTSLEALFASVGKQDYLALLAYLPHTHPLEEQFQKIVSAIQKRCDRPTTFGWGPRYLHSTGQLHKGDANRGVFLIISDAIDEPAYNELRIPGEAFDFAMLVQAQAHGDYLALTEQQRRVAHVVLKGRPEEGLRRLAALLG